MDRYDQIILAQPPRCIHEGCTQKACWQIGVYIPFRAAPRFYCTEHLPGWARNEVAQGNYTDERPEAAGRR